MIAKSLNPFLTLRLQLSHKLNGTAVIIDVRHGLVIYMNITQNYRINQARKEL